MYAIRSYYVLLVTLVFWGTLVKGGLVMFALSVFAEAGNVWPVVLTRNNFV